MKQHTIKEHRCIISSIFSFLREKQEKENTALQGHVMIRLIYAQEHPKEKCQDHYTCKRLDSDDEELVAKAIEEKATCQADGMKQ